MSFLSTIRKLFSPPATIPRQPVVYMRSLPKGRTSTDGNNMPFSSNWTFVPPTDFDANWEIVQFDQAWFERLRLSPSKLVDILIDFSPEVSRALWDYLRMSNAGWEHWAEAPGGIDEHELGNRATQTFIEALEDRYGSMDVVINRMLLSGFVRGAICVELVLDRRGRMPLDLAIVDPSTIRFRKRQDINLGEIWQPGQWIDGKFVPLDIPTFCYLPIDPMLNSPYGRPVVAPAIGTALFTLGVMHDLRRVIQQQGWPKLDIEIDLEKLAAIAPQMMTDGQHFSGFVQNVVDSVASYYGTLEPDDAYVHTSDTVLNRPVGALDSASIGAIDTVIQTLERMITRALKSNSLMMDLGESTSESEANRKYEMYMAGIRSLQHSVEAVLSRLLTLALEAQGIPAKVVWRFAESRASERLRDAQAAMMEIANERAKYDHGWVSQDEASEMITGRPADAPEPRNTQAAAPEMVQGDNDGGEAHNQASTERRILIAELRAGRVAIANAVNTVATNGYHPPA